jgi:4-amino-4-deoxy-L-arabinose transferase-like glycosyltransferase
MRIWRTPPDQPTGTRPALLLIAVLAGLTYGWGMSRQAVEVYYAAAARSMAQSWHNFVFAAFDPDATISLDKLPGGLWPQALSVRIFGPHIWALVLPQVIEGSLAVLVLFTAVRRFTGAAAALVAVAVLAVTPAAIALNRGNVSDSLLILLLLCAAAATAKAVESQRPPSRPAPPARTHPGSARWLLLAGGCVGLAFQAKMIEAWLILPALAVTWLLAGHDRLIRRLAQIGAAGLVTLAVSLVWIVAVSLVPAHDRPAVDGSRHNSLFEQVFVYNASGRLTLLHTQSPVTAADAPAPLAEATLDSSSWVDRIVAGRGGLDAGWLLPAAVLAGVAVLVARRQEPRTDPTRAGAVLWLVWLAVELAAFTTSNTLNPYYLAALAPPIAGLIGTGVAVAFPTLVKRGPAGTVLGLAGATVLYGCWLLAPAGGVRFAALGGAVVLLAAAALLLTGAIGRLSSRGRLTAVALVLAATFVEPALASASLIRNDWGPFDTPYEPAATSDLTQTQPLAVLQHSAGTVALLRRVQGSARYPAATISSLVAAPMIFATGVEILPVGGFTGVDPEPTVDQLQAAVARGDVRVFITVHLDDPRVAWIEAHCRELPTRPTVPTPGVELSAYYC